MNGLTPDEIKNSNGRRLLSDFLNENSGNTDSLDKFDALTQLYAQVNSVINISALKTADDIYIKHYLDSIYPYKQFEGSCCDVGCGGGFPCIPLSIVTGLHFLGIDGVGKKLELIKRCKSELGITNLDCEHIRSEELAKSSDKFDTVCCRAVADTDKALTFCAPIVKQGGKIILYKTPKDGRAQNSAEKKCGAVLENIIDYTLSGTDIKRRLIVYRKIK